MWGFIRLTEAGIQAQLNGTKPIRVKAYMNAASVRIMAQQLHAGKCIGCEPQLGDVLYFQNGSQKSNVGVSHIQIKKYIYIEASH